MIHLTTILFLTHPGIGWSCDTGTARLPFRQFALHITALGWGIKEDSLLVCSFGNLVRFFSRSAVSQWQIHAETRR
jgi:hypothetical protein